MDRIFIRNLTVDTIIGIHEHEKREAQPLVIDLEMANDIRPAAASRDIGDALDYQAITERLRAYLETSECLLVETLAEELAGMIMEEFDVPWLRLTLTKPQAMPGSTLVGLTIERP
ncbi:MAG: dihydroneopterin aldolase [Gammaproteobacteria bacterium]|nr:MAG: dihydroneopterin aldolase [Gammaproteobacteria bacterium]PIE34688.1 MAG: dihydroneopterin aldolase [Gammaproteobacteria bacterium]